MKSFPPSFSGFSQDHLNGLLIAAVLILLIIVIRIAQSLDVTDRRRTYRPWQARRSPSASKTIIPFKAQPQTARHPPTDLRDPAQQMHAIAAVDFETTPLLNRSEARLLPVLENITRHLNQGHRVMAQTSLGEIIRPSEKSGTADQRTAAYASINSKRLDFAIIDKFGRLALAIEYQGTGHYHTTSFMRDAVKREVLRKAGVQMYEVPADFNSASLTQSLLEILAQNGPPRPTVVS